MDQGSLAKAEKMQSTPRAVPPLRRESILYRPASASSFIKSTPRSPPMHQSPMTPAASGLGPRSRHLRASVWLGLSPLTNLFSLPGCLLQVSLQLHRSALLFKAAVHVLTSASSPSCVTFGKPSPQTYIYPSLSLAGTVLVSLRAKA